jgi:hypothetical protein
MGGEKDSDRPCEVQTKARGHQAGLKIVQNNQIGSASQRKRNNRSFASTQLSSQGHLWRIRLG